MPAFDGSRTVLSADANYTATDWAQAQGGAQLDFKATAELKRGFDLELGASALVSLDASISKFLVADLRGQANASARVRGQVQVPLDLFDEIGFAVRLQAVAEAAAGVELGIGLNVGDFLALAGEDPRMKGVALRLLRVLLAEAEIKGGVLAKAAAAAMAYANLSATGTLVGAKAGFVVAAEAGVGLKAGAGFRVFGAFGIAQPARLVRRTVDAVVDETLARISEGTTDAAVLRTLDELRAPAKMALRTAFEVGAELARNSSFDPASGPILAQRCLQVMLEEAQRYLLDKLVDLGLERFRDQLQAAGFARSAWDAAQAQREALASTLEAYPEDPFEPSAENKAYWRDVVARSADLAAALAAAGAVTRDAWVEGIAVTWAAVQLAMRAANRIGDAGARATLLSASADASFAPFQGGTVEPAPQIVSDHINKALRPSGPTSPLTEEDLVVFLLEKPVVDALINRFPSARTVLDVVGGAGSAHGIAMAAVFQNLGAFVPSAGGRVDPAASLRAVVEGLATYVHTRLVSELDSRVRPILAGRDPELALYLNEVLLDSLGFAMNSIHEGALAWAGGDQQGHAALREACSAVVMRIFGRSLVVATDVLMAKAMAEISGGLRRAVPELNRRDGVIDHLAKAVPLDRTLLRDTVTEMFEIASEVFSPLPLQQRARLRELMYRVMDTAPQAGTGSLVVELRNDMSVPNAEAAVELAMELGTVIGTHFVRLVNRLLDLILDAVMDLIEDTLRAIEAEIAAWIRDLQAIIAELARLIAVVVEAIAQLGAQLVASTDRLLDTVESLLRVVADRRNTLRSAILDVAFDGCKGLLGDVPGYSLLPSSARDDIRAMLRETVDGLLDQRVIDDIEDLLETMAAGASEFVSDVRDIDPTDDVPGAIVELLADAVEDAVREAFGDAISLAVDFRAQGRYRGPRIDTPWGSYRPELSFDLRINLGTVRIDIDDVVAFVRSVVRGLDAVKEAANAVANDVVRVIDLEHRLQDKELEEADHRTRQAESRRRLDETQTAAGSVAITSPGPGAAYPGVVPVEILLVRVPRSFLAEAEGEPARVLLFLNDVPLDLGRFSIEQAEGDRRALVSPGLRDTHPIVRERLAQRVQPGGVALKQRGRKRTSALSAVPWPQRAFVGRGGLPDRVPGGRSLRVGNMRSSFAGRTTVGRRPPNGQRAAQSAFDVARLVVRGALQISDLRDGFNTLTVVVVNGSARARITESVVFFAADQARVRPPADVPGRPVIPAAGYIDPNLLAPALRQLAGARTARRALTGPPPPGAKRIAFSSLYPASSKEARHEAAAALVSRLSEQTRMAGLLREKLRMLETGESA